MGSRRLRPSFLGVLIVGASLYVAGCVPAHQYPPLKLTALDLGHSRTLAISSNALWRDTGIEVRQGEVYRVATQGTWSAAPLCGPTDATGLEVEHLFCMKGIFAGAFPLPEGRIGALVGRIGVDGKTFLVGGPNGFIADSGGTLFLRMNDGDGFLWDNAGEIEVAVQRYGEGVGAVAFSATSPGAAASPPTVTRVAATAPAPRPTDTGFYGAERDIAFNVLETVSFDSATGRLSVTGRFDAKFAGPRIPYLQHLAVFLENPAPQVSLDWTPAFERRVAAFFRRMDDEREMANLVGGGQLVDSAGRITRKGQLFLPLFGVKAFEHGNAAGALGADVRLKELGVVTVTRVVPGSAADRAGLRVGDDIHMLTTADGVPRQPHVPDKLMRTVRFAGAGAQLKMEIARPTGMATLDVTLDAFTGDSWAHMTKYDVNERIFHAAGKTKAAQLIAALGELVRYQNTEAGQLAMWSVMFATDTKELFERNRDRYQRGEMPRNAAMAEWVREVVRGMERNIGLPANSIMPVYDEAYRRTGDPYGPMDLAIAELNRRMEPFVKEALRTALHKNDEIAMPVAVLDESADFAPEVTPRYIAIPSDSELARLFVEADYVGKAIVHRPELARRIPAYRTEYAFAGDRPGRVEETTNRLWIAPARIDVHRAPDNATLRFGRVDMGFNIGRAIGGGVEQRDEDYSRFLTSIYDGLAAEFPPLHELREAAKLQVAARWIASLAPGFRLPAEGRAQLVPPATMEGFVTLIWSPQRVKVSLIAPGGIDFNVPLIGPSGPVFPDDATVAVPIDAAVADLRDAVAADLPAVDPLLFRSGAAAALPERYRRPLTAPPVPASVRLVALADKGRGTLGRLSGLRTEARLDRGRCDASRSRALRDKLNEATSIARQLQGVEDALNAITTQAPERQRTFERIEKTFREEQERLREAMLDLASGGLLDAYGEIKGHSRMRSIQDFETLIAAGLAAKDKLGDIGANLANLDLALSAVMARSLNERETATKSLFIFIKDTVAEGADIGGTDAVSRALRTAGKTLGIAGKVQTALDGTESWYKIAAAAEALQRLDAQSELEAKGLRDSLLPLQRKLSDRLDTAMNDPLVRALESDSGQFDCG